jgi:hypothetical protein
MKLKMKIKQQRSAYCHNSLKHMKSKKEAVYEHNRKLQKLKKELGL